MINQLNKKILNQEKATQEIISRNKAIKNFFNKLLIMINNLNKSQMNREIENLEIVIL